MCLFPFFFIFGLGLSNINGAVLESKTLPADQPQPDTIAQLEARLDVMMLAISNQKYENAALKLDLASLKDENTIFKANITSLQNEKIVLEQNVLDLMTREEQLNNSLQSYITSSVQNNVEFRKKMSLIESEATVMKQDMIYLNQEALQAKQEDKDMEQQLSHVNNTIDYIENKMKDVSEKCTQLSGEIVRNVSRIGDRIQAVDIKHTSTESTLSSKLQSAQQSLSSLNQNYNSLASTYSTLNQRYSSLSSQMSSSGRCAAFATLSEYKHYTALHGRIVFDRVKENHGSCYSNGVFTASTHGFYYFSWVVYSYEDTRITSEVIKNGYIIGQIYASGSYDNGASLSIAIELYQGQQIYLRSKDSGYVYGNDFSSFSGCQIF
ncbi:uncharacterized protein [Mytilus edulis]|uniref:uncharacterized protein n=1 Tax=Mytilus edulis TaxID=6550 RepID=UPI0039EFC25B